MMALYIAASEHGRPPDCCVVVVVVTVRGSDDSIVFSIGAKIFLFVSLSPR